MKRYALIAAQADKIRPYLPGNYDVIWEGDGPHEGTVLPGPVTVVAGSDVAGWTLDDYVIPRLASGLYFAKEIDLSHPIMKEVPDAVGGIGEVVDDWFTFEAAKRWMS